MENVKLHHGGDMGPSEEAKRLGWSGQSTASSEETKSWSEKGSVPKT